MKKTYFRPALHAALVSLALGCATARAQDAARVFVQGSEVNLRAAPSTTAEVVKKVTIGTECQPQGEAAKQWVRLKCGDVEGYTLKSLVGPDKPQFEALLAQAQAAQTDVKPRLDAAARAATLNPQSDQALTLLADLFFEANFKQLAKDTKKGGLHESFVATCNKAFSHPPLKSYSSCLTAELEKIEYDWHQIRFQDREFISAMFRDGALVVYSGRITPRPGKGRFSDDDDDFNIIIESRSTSPVAEAVKAALSQKAVSSQERDKERPRPEEKYSSILKEGPGMPVLDAASIQIYRTLPPVWRYLSEERGVRFIDSTCGVIQTLVLKLDVHRRASLLFDDANGSFEDQPLNGQVLKLTKIDSTTYRFFVHEDAGDDQVVLTWPTSETNVSSWKGEKFFFRTTAYFGLAQAKNIKIRKNCQDAG